MWDVCGQNGIGAAFLRVLRFPLPIRIPPIAPQSLSSIIRGWYNRPNGGRSTKWTQSHPMGKIKRKILHIWLLGLLVPIEEEGNTFLREVG
jgi:hypothetical protein